MERILQVLFVSAVCMVGTVSTVCAQRGFVPSSTRQVHHYLAISIGGGEANNLPISNMDSIESRMGGAANVGLHYEAQYHSWLFGLAVEGQYQHLRDDVVSPFVDKEKRTYIDPMFGNQDDIAYSYCYSQYTERNRVMNAAISVYGGREFTNLMYVLAGVKFSYWLETFSACNIEALLSTRATYADAMLDITSGLFLADQAHDQLYMYGVFEPRMYTGTPTCTDYMRVAPFAECGCYIPLPSQKMRLRAGIYAMYGFRIGKKQSKPLAEYNAVDKQYGSSQSPQMLQESIHLNSLMESSKYTALPHNLEIGLKMTLLMDVTIEKRICRCMR